MVLGMVVGSFGQRLGIFAWSSFQPILVETMVQSNGRFSLDGMRQSDDPMQDVRRIRHADLLNTHARGCYES